MTGVQHLTVRRHVVIWSLVLGVFSLVVMVTGYFGAQRLLQDDLDSRLEHRASLFIEAADRGGNRAVLAAIKHYSRRGLRTFTYKLTGASGQAIFGPENVPLLKPGWASISLADLDDEEDELARIRTVELRDGSILSLVADTDYLDTFDHIISMILGVGVTLTCVVGACAGLSLNALVLNRLAAVNDTAAELAKVPDLSVRVPITDRRDEFDAVAATCNAMLDRIDRLVAENDLVLGYVAHDLRAPLVRLAERLADARLATAGEAEQQLEVAEEGIADLLNLFDAFLAIGRRIDRPVGASKSIDLSTQVRELADSFAIVAAASGRDLRARIEPNLNVRADESLVSQLIINLIENAIRHTPGQTQINLSLTSTGRHAQLIVSDDGRERHLKADAAAERIMQHGVRQRLGLKLVRSIAEAHGGSFANLKTEQGTTAQVLLPLA